MERRGWRVGVEGQQCWPGLNFQSASRSGLRAVAVAVAVAVGSRTSAATSTSYLFALPCLHFQSNRINAKEYTVRDQSALIVGFKLYIVRYEVQFDGRSKGRCLSRAYRTDGERDDGQ